MTKHMDTGIDVLAVTAARLRELRQSWGYDTAAGFARAIGYKPRLYQAYERRVPNRVGTFVTLLNAISTVGPVSADWIMSRRPSFIAPVVARAALRIRSGVPVERVREKFRQEQKCALLAYQQRFGPYDWGANDGAA